MQPIKYLKSKLDLTLLPPQGSAGARADAREMAASAQIPYTVHYDDWSVVTKHDGLVQVIQVGGLQADSLTDEQVKVFERRRNTVLRTIASPDIAVYVHLVRRKVHAYPFEEGGTWFARQLQRAWRNRIEQRGHYVNEIYISLVRRRFKRGFTGLVDRVLASLSAPKLEADVLESFEKMATDLHKAAEFVTRNLSDYAPRRLCIQRAPEFEGEQVTRDIARRELQRMKRDWSAFTEHHGQAESYAASDVLDFMGDDHSEIGAFFHYLINLEDARVPADTLELDRTLAKSYLDFKTVGNMMAVENLGGERVAAVLSMADWPARTPSRMLQGFLETDAEFIITQSFQFTDRISAEHELRQEHRRITSNDTQGVGEDDKQEIVSGLKDLTRGKTVNGIHHLSILVHVPAIQNPADPLLARKQTIAALDGAVDRTSKSFVGLGVKPVREWLGVETFYWAQLPGQATSFIGRRGKIKSNNFAGFASLHSFAVGKAEGNLWGPAIMAVETAGGTLYYLNFHREMEGMVPGHTAIGAETGTGKTALLSAAVAMADKVEPRIFWFDNREGAKCFIRAMGGVHTTLRVLGTSGWNPLRLPDTEQNRAYLVDLLTLMRTCYGAKISSDDVDRFRSAVTENFNLPLADRRLRNVAWCFGQGELARDMAIWHGEGANAGLFDNAEDTIDLTRARHFCFEMRELINGDQARPELAVVLSYPFHRIELAMNGEPFIIVLEEMQNLVKHAYWRAKIDNYIMQIRRKNGLMVFVTPDPKYFYCETDAILKQSATGIYLPSQNAQRSDLIDHIGLTESEFEFIRDTPPEARKFLIRRGNESVRAVFDLSPELNDFIPLLSSNDKGVALMEQIIDELGTDAPDIWVPVFMRRARELNTHNLNQGNRK